VTAILRRIERHGQAYFRQVKCLTRKEELLAEMRGLTWKWRGLRLLGVPLRKGSLGSGLGQALHAPSVPVRHPPRPPTGVGELASDRERGMLFNR
jgi:hypothetical protein